MATSVYAFWFMVEGPPTFASYRKVIVIQFMIDSTAFTKLVVL